MSKMGNTIVDIQELAYAGVPNEQISKTTDTSIDFVESVVNQLFETQSELYTEPDEYYND